MKIQIKRWDNNDVIFEHECNDNSIKLTLEKGVDAGISFNYAELNYAELNYAELNHAELNGAELNHAELNYAELNHAKLPTGNVVINDKWHIHIRTNYIKIGCQKKDIDWWRKLSTEVAEEEFNSGAWWKQWKPIVLAIWESMQ